MIPYNLFENILSQKKILSVEQLKPNVLFLVV